MELLTEGEACGRLLEATLLVRPLALNIGRSFTLFG